MKRLCAVCALFVFLFCFSSCRSAPEDAVSTLSTTAGTNITETTTSTFPATTQTITQTTLPPVPVYSQKAFVALAAIRDVIQNKKTFFQTSDGEYIYLKDFVSMNWMYVNDNGDYVYDETNNYDEPLPFSYDQFCVVDMDNDGYPEMILERDNPNAGRVVLHYEDGIVYGFLFPYRMMAIIKSDGSYDGSSSAAYTVIGKIHFSKNRASFTEICLSDEIYQSTNVYRINGQNVSQEDAYAYFQTWYATENVYWYPYNDATVDIYVPVY